MRVDLDAEEGGLEELAYPTSLVVDKTGALTYATLRLQAIEIEHADHSPLLQLAGHCCR